MSEPTSTSPRRRLRELLAIPERQRTDAQWDELNELEISLAPVNRIEPLRLPDDREPSGPPNRPPKQPRGGGARRQLLKPGGKKPRGYPPGVAETASAPTPGDRPAGSRSRDHGASGPETGSGGHD